MYGVFVLFICSVVDIRQYRQCCDKRTECKVLAFGGRVIKQYLLKEMIVLRD